ncbi:uncharacterized protein LOC108840550 isoform X2 [Raphanus sativus]|nr:uncharacterized protein LOC108840550 isoform X2 [Raphanus sativus]
MTQLGSRRVPGTEKAMQYLTLEADKLPEALEFYAKAFQAKLIDDEYENKSVQLKILNSYVIISPMGAGDCFLELPTDLNTIQRFRHDKRFAEVDLKRPIESESVMLKDPFGIYFLLVEKKKKNDHGGLLYYGRHPDPIAYEFPKDVRPDELCTIKLTALFVTRYGIAFLKALEEKIVASTEEWFGFLEVNHIRGSLFHDFLGVYASILEPSKEVDRSCDFMGKALELFFHLLQLEKVKMGVSKSVMEVDAFTAAADYLAYMDVVGYSDVMPLPQRRSVMIAQLKEQTLRRPMSAPLPSWSSTIFCVSPEVLGVIKLTAMFAARYGKRIGWELMEKVGKRPLFSFLDPSDDCGFTCYNMVVKVYSKVLENFELLYTTDIVLERYFQCLQWDEEKDELKDLDDLYSFVECVDSFAQMEDQDFYHFMGNLHHPHVYPFHDQTSLVHSRAHVLCPFHHETSPANVQEEGSSSVEVSVPTVNGRKVMEITVDSWLLEKVASLKEKIAKMMQMQAKELKLRRKSGGVLKEDKSLADNNVEAGEMLTATWRFSRWEV